MVCGVLLLLIIIRIHCFILIIIQIKKGKRKSVLLPHTIIILFVLLCFLYYTSEYLSLNKLYNQRTGETFGYLYSHFRPFFLCIEHHHCSYFICNTHTRTVLVRASWTNGRCCQRGTTRQRGTKRKRPTPRPQRRSRQR